MQKIQPFLTGKNLLLALLIVAVFVLLYLLLSGSPWPATNDTAIRQLQQQLHQLQQQNEMLRRQDSVLLSDYARSIEANKKKLEQLKSNLNENIKKIDSYNADSIRAAFGRL